MWSPVSANLLCPIWYSGHISWYLAHCRPLLFQTFLHLSYELFDAFVDLIRGVFELSGHTLDFFVERHVSGRSGVGQFGVEDGFWPALCPRLQLIVVSFLPSYAITKRTEGLSGRKVDRCVSRTQKLEEQHYEEEKGGEDVKIGESW
jgi:hypothetical protein